MNRASKKHFLDRTSQGKISWAGKVKKLLFSEKASQNDISWTVLGKSTYPFQGKSRRHFLYRAIQDNISLAGLVKTTCLGQG